MESKKRWGWQKCEAGETIPAGAYRRCRATGLGFRDKDVRAKSDRLACSDCEIWKGCGTPGCDRGFMPHEDGCFRLDPNGGPPRPLSRSILDASGEVIGYESKCAIALRPARPEVNEQIIDEIASKIMKESPDPIALRPRGTVDTYDARSIRMTIHGRHYSAGGESCRCGTMEGAQAMGFDRKVVGDRCCVECSRVDVERRILRGSGGGSVACYACRPRTGYERLERRRGKPFDVGESPDDDVSKVLDDLERLEKLAAITEPVGTRGYWEQVIEVSKPTYLTVRDVVSALAATFDIAGQFVDERSLSYAVFVAANLDEVMRRAEVQAGQCVHNVRLRRVLETMWTDPTYANARAAAEESAARIWKAREVWR